MPEATFFVSLSMWLLQSSLLSIVTPRDFAVVTWLTWLSLIVIVGESVDEHKLGFSRIQSKFVFPQPIVNIF